MGGDGGPVQAYTFSIVRPLPVPPKSSEDKMLLQINFFSCRGNESFQSVSNFLYYPSENISNLDFATVPEPKAFEQRVENWFTLYISETS